MAASTRYLAPTNLEELARCAARTGTTILAGGTDLHPRWMKEVLPKPDAVLDVKAVADLHGIALRDDEVTIGACTIMSELEEDPIIRAGAPLLAEAAGRVACPQIRNRATIGGNLCNASPAADTAVPLIVLDAECELAAAGPGGIALRRLPASEFFKGPGLTALKPGEILARIRFKPLPRGWFSAWEKFGTRPAMEIAVAAVGLVLKLKAGIVEHVRVGYGSVAPIPLRGRQAEAELTGRRLTDEVIARCSAAAREEIAPVTDLRATEAYRRRIVGVMLTRMLEDARA